MLGSDPMFEVSEFVAVFNQSVEMAYPRVGIVGELANLRISRNQWVFLDLKDEAAQIKFFGTVRQLPGPLEDGLKLEIYGRPQLHPKYGFSVVIESLRVSGKGSIKKARDLLEKKLQAEGLFDPARKRPLPFAPAKVGLITALDSAACADFRKIVDARWGNISLQAVDVMVQGSESAGQIARALQSFNELADPPAAVVLIRGGGSPEDLDSFSDERVVRAVSASRIPTLVAIGHETDISLAELAADRRASTPSNAAEMIVPDKAHEKRVLDMYHLQMRELLGGKVNRLNDMVKENRRLISQLMEDVCQTAASRLQTNKSLLALLDPNAPLRRGYALVYGPSGNLIKSSSQVKSGDRLSISLADGTIEAKTEEKLKR